MSSNFLNNNSRLFGSGFGPNPNQALFNPMMGSFFLNILNDDEFSKDPKTPRRDKRKNKFEEKKTN